MKKEDNNDIDFLEKNLDRMNYWLQFAEAKNAGLIAAIIAIVAFVVDTSEVGCIWLRIVIYVLSGFSLLMCFFSLIPQISKNMIIKKKDKKKKNENTPTNLYFWCDISQMSREEYLNEVSSCISCSDLKNNKQAQMIADETIENSKIASSKYLMFGIGIKAFVVVLIMVCIELIIVA